MEINDKMKWIAQVYEAYATFEKFVMPYNDYSRLIQ